MQRAQSGCTEHRAPAIPAVPWENLSCYFCFLEVSCNELKRCDLLEFAAVIRTKLNMSLRLILLTVPWAYVVNVIGLVKGRGKKKKENLLLFVSPTQFSLPTATSAGSCLPVPKELQVRGGCAPCKVPSQHRAAVGPHLSQGAAVCRQPAPNGSAVFIRLCVLPGCLVPLPLLECIFCSSGIGDSW